MDKGLCDHCNTLGCIFATNVKRDKCDYYTPIPEGQVAVVFDRMPNGCGQCRLCMIVKDVCAYCMATGYQLKYSETDLRDGMCPMISVQELKRK